MRIRIQHETTYRYAEPVKSAIQLLRLTPRSHEGQTILHWAIDSDHGSRLMRREDWYGNIMHSLYAEGPIDQIGLKVVGEVETADVAGVIRGSAERFPPMFYLRETPLTAGDAAIYDFATSVAGHLQNPLDKTHALMGALNERLRFDVAATDAGTKATEAFAAGHGVCQDFTHIFLASARRLGIPARYVSGYLHKPDETVQEAGHAWAEAYIENVGWVSFDAANAVSVTEHYVRVAIGLDSTEAAPVRGTYYGLSREDLAVSLKIESARQIQA
ncbi:transglutaminase domain-containing protein [Microvirga sp. 2MCAF38]|uniref:transglutaminase family protein n=1 Tax=Microvirga sp. 2MCAF38 TaxID=3232989 RepID=UPI003F9C6CE4